MRCRGGEISRRTPFVFAVSPLPLGSKQLIHTTENSATITIVSETNAADGSVTIFCSYSHKDERCRKQFESHVAQLTRENLIRIWQDRKIVAGGDWAGEIDDNLSNADIVALFVSSDFLASNYCYEREMKVALERDAKDETRVLPIIVRPCDWHNAPFNKLQAIPTDAKPITKWRNRDEAWTVVANCLRLTVKVVMEKLQKKLQEEEKCAALLKDSESVAFIFGDDDPEKTAEQKRKAYAWASEIRAERLKTLEHIRQKIGAIEETVFSGDNLSSKELSYRLWYEYQRRA